MTALFAIATAEVFIVNIKADSINTNAASNFTMLKDIFELNIRLKTFKKDVPKTFLFIIRDYKKKD